MISPLKRKPRHPPFVMAFKAIIRDARLSIGARLLLHILKSYSDSSGLHCYPGENTLARDMGCGLRSVQRWIAELRDRGMLSTDQRHNKDGKASTLAYLLDDERRAKLAAPPKKRLQPHVGFGGRSMSDLAGGEARKVVPFTEETQASC